MDHSSVGRGKGQKILYITEIKVMTSTVDTMDLAHAKFMD